MIKKYFITFLATVLIFNTTFESLGTVSYAEELQEEYSLEFDEEEEGEDVENVQDKEIVSVSDEIIIETISEEISIADREETNCTEESVDEPEFDSTEEYSFCEMSKEEVRENETETCGLTESIFESESFSEIEVISKTESIITETQMLALDFDMVELCIGETKQVKAVSEFGDTIVEDVIWTSSDNEVATVENGKIVAVGVGEATITATSVICNGSASCLVKVLEEKSAKGSLSLNYSELIMEIDDCEQLIVSIDGEEVSSQDIIWKSEDEDIVFVEEGYVYAVSVGKTIVIADIISDKQKLVCEILVKDSKIGRSISMYASPPPAKQLPALTGNKRLDAAAIAYSQVGYVEGSNNNTIYGPQNEWCVYFARWCVLKAGLDGSKWLNTGSTNTLIGWFQKQGRWHNRDKNKWSVSSKGSSSDGSDDGYIPQPGDFAAVENGKGNGDTEANNAPDHTALVWKVDNNYIYTVEGNVGDKVVTRRYNRSNLHYSQGTYIVGFGEPDYGETTQPINKTPQGWLDEIHVSDDSIIIRGWAKDDNDPNRAVEIKMEVGGSTYTTTANQYRSDVGSHGFSATFKVNCYGTQTVNVYAVDADINQKFLLSDGSRTVTIQRPYKIEYGVSEVNIPYGGSQRISFNFQADGVSSFDIATGNGIIAQAGFDGFDWNNGIGYVKLTSGSAVGNTDLTISFLDSNNNKIYKKTIPVTVTGNFDIQFNPRISYVRENEKYLINFTVTGRGFKQFKCSLSDPSVAIDLDWREEGFNSETGECGIYVKGIKKGTTFLTIELWDINGKKVYQKECTVWVRDGLDINFGDKQMKVAKNSSKSYPITYKGYGVSDISVVSEDTSIAKVSLENKEISNGKADIVINGCKRGKTKVFLRLLNAKGDILLEKGTEVVIHEAFKIYFEDDMPQIWLGETKNINYTLENNYHEMYGLEYKIEEGEDVVQIATYGGGNNGSRWIALKGLKSGTALLAIRIYGLVGTEEVVLYEESIRIFVLELKISPTNKTVYVGNSFSLESYCNPVTPTNLSLSYTSSDNTVASVDNKGLVTPKKKGKADITVSTSDKKQSVVCKLTVVEETVIVQGITVSPTEKELTVGDTFALKITIQPSNATDNEVSYISSDDSVVTVDKFGRINAIGVGDAKITVTTHDGNKKAYCNVSVNPTIIASGKTGDLDWKITDDKGAYTLTISGNGAMADYDGNHLSGWNQYRESLKYLVLEEGITKIGEGAFVSCHSFCGELKLPSSLKTIGSDAFSSCDGFNGELRLPKGITSIGQYAFAGCTGFNGDIIIPNGIERIEKGTFKSCSGFDGKLVIPDSVKVIAYSAFEMCTGISGMLVLPNGLEEIEPYAFFGCNHLSGNLILPESLTKIEGYAFKNCSGFTGDIKMPDNISKASEGIFYNCTGLSGTLELSKNLKEVEFGAFTNTGFQVVIIPQTVTKIRGLAFYNIPFLTVYFEGNAPERISAEDRSSPSFSSDVQIYYNSEASGWSTPKWNGYLAEPVSGGRPSYIPVEGIGLGVSGEYLSVGESYALEYWLIPENTTETDVIWESSDSSVVTVDENGFVKAVGYGEAFITASTKNGKYSKRCDILVVKQPDPTLYIEFDENNPWMWVGETKTLKLRCGGRGFVGVGQAVYDSEIAKFVDWGDTKYTKEGEGIYTQTHEERSMDITGISPGKTKVAVRLYNGRANLLYQNYTEITVADLELSEYYIEMNAGDTHDSIQASVYPEIGIPIKVNYKSSDETVVTIDENGILKALKPGEAAITVTSADGVVSKQCDVFVYDGNVYDKDNKYLAAPSANIKSGGSVEKGTKIILTCEETEADIHYTTDGSAPTRRSAVYTKPIELLEDTVIKAFAVKEGYKDSDIVTYTYKIKSNDTEPETPSEPESGKTEESAPTEESSENEESSAIKDGADEDPQDGVKWHYKEQKVTYKDLSVHGKIVTAIKPKTYDGTPYKPAVKVTAVENGKTITLTEGTDYRVLYFNNIHAGTATVTVRGNGVYKGTISRKFEIKKKPCKKLKVLADSMPKGTTAAPKIYVYDGATLLKENKDYTLDGITQNLTATKGKKQFYVIAASNSDYEGTTTARLTVYDADQSRVQGIINNPSAVKLSQSTYSYNGKACKPIAVVTINGKTLTAGKDYTVTYQNNKETGTAYAIITGKGAYAGSVVKKFTIKPLNGEFTLKKPIAAATYNGRLQKPKFTIMTNGKTLKPNKDYTLTYKNNLHATDRAKVTVRGKGNYANIPTKTFYFTINPCQIKKVSVKGAQGSLIITYAKHMLVEGVDYDIIYGNTVGKNKITVTIKAKEGSSFTGEMIKKINKR